MRERWEVKRLDEVCDNLDNQRIPITKNKRVEGSIPYYGASGIVDYVKDYIFDENLLLISEDGANLVARTYPIAFSISGKNWVNNHAHVLRFDDMDSQKYVEYYFNFIKLDDYISGMAQPKLNQKMLNSIKIPTPSLHEQKQIVKTLDLAFKHIDQAKANLEKNLNNAKELFASKLNKVFSQRGEGWVEKTWNNVLEIRSGRNQKEVENPNGKYPILGSAGKIMGYADKYLCDEGTTIVGRKGTIDKPLYIETKFWNVDTAFGLMVGNLLEKKYLYYFCKGFNFKSLDKGTTLPSLVKKDLVKIKMLIPPKEEQVKIIELTDELVKNMNKLQTHYQQNLNNLEELKKSILEKAFKGEL